MAFEPNDDDDLDFGEITAALEAVEEASGVTMLTPGDIIGGGRFTVREHIGEGAFGEVWRVFDELLQRDLAVKVVRIQTRVAIAERDELTARVLREAQAAQAAGTRCAHIVRIFDVASLPSGDPFLVMEFLDGATLRRWLNVCAPTEWAVARHIGLQCARALRALHACGFVHRDIKPDNIFALDDEADPALPFIKLIDFGLAKDLEAGRLTRTTASIGTQRYMAPEQSLSQRATPRSDVFSLGIVLFEVLTGRNPLPVAAHELRVAYTDGLPSIRAHAPALPDWLADAVDRCLAIDPEDRPDAQGLIEILEGGEAAVTATTFGATLPPLPDLEVTPDLPSAPSLPSKLPCLSDPLLSEQQDFEPASEPQSPRATLELDAIVIDPAPLPALPAPEPMAGIAIDREPLPVLPAPEPNSEFDDDRPVRTWAPERTRSRGTVPLAIALFAGLVIIAFVVRSPAPAAVEPQLPTVASEPELTFKPRGPVDEDDFPRGQPPSIGSASAPPSVAAASAISAPPSDAPATDAARIPVKRASRPPVQDPARRMPRRGLAKSFAAVRDAALARSQNPAAESPPLPAIGRAKDAFDDDAGAQFGLGVAAPKTAVPGLPEGTHMPAKLVTGISSAAHDVVLARLTKDVVVDGAVVLKAGDILKGRSRNDFERVFIKFTQARRGDASLTFAGNAVTDGQPGLPAAKRRIPEGERGTNVLARGALSTAGGVAARLSGGVAGDLASDVTREGVSEVRPDFRPRDPFVLTVPRGTRFSVVVVGR